MYDVLVFLLGLHFFAMGKAAAKTSTTPKPKKQVTPKPKPVPKSGVPAKRRKVADDTIPELSEAEKKQYDLQWKHMMDSWLFIYSKILKTFLISEKHTIHWFNSVPHRVIYESHILNT